MDGNFTVKVVLARMTYRKGVLDRVRSLLLGTETDLVEIFTRACEHLPLLERIMDTDEHAHFLRIEKDDELIALAALTFDSDIEGPIPYRIDWRRDPAPVEVELWQNQIQECLDHSSYSDWERDPALQVANDLKLKLIYNLMHTRKMALPSSEVYPALYKVESRMGLNYARGIHITEDLGM